MAGPLIVPRDAWSMVTLLRISALCAVLFSTTTALAQEPWVVRAEAVELGAVLAKLPRQADAIVGLELAPSRMLAAETFQSLEKAIVQAVLRHSGVREVRIVVGRRSEELDYVVTAELLPPGNGTDPPVLFLELLDVEGATLGGGTCADVFLRVVHAPPVAPPVALREELPEIAPPVDNHPLKADLAPRTQGFYAQAWHVGMVPVITGRFGTSTQPRPIHANGTQVSDDEVLRHVQDPAVKAGIENGRRSLLVNMGSMALSMLLPLLMLPGAFMGIVPVVGLIAANPRGPSELMFVGVIGMACLGILGLLVTTIAMVVVAFVPGLFFKGLSAEDVYAIVRTRNLHLAEELGLDATTLAPEYFPGGIPRPATPASTPVTTDEEELAPTEKPQ